MAMCHRIQVKLYIPVPQGPAYLGQYSFELERDIISLTWFQVAETSRSLWRGICLWVFRSQPRKKRPWTSGSVADGPPYPAFAKKSVNTNRAVKIPSKYSFVSRDDLCPNDNEVNIQERIWHPNTPGEWGYLHLLPREHLTMRTQILSHSRGKDMISWLAEPRRSMTWASSSHTMAKGDPFASAVRHIPIDCIFFYRCECRQSVHPISFHGNNSDTMLITYNLTSWNMKSLLTHEIVNQEMNDHTNLT